MIKNILIDIDNTLWDFASVLYENLKALNSSLPGITMWKKWDFWKEYINEKDFFAAIRSIHLQQDNVKFVPYIDSKFFLDSLKEKGFAITIASHRDKDTLETTVSWLKTHELSFDEVCLTYDKSSLFPHSSAVVDDSPVILDSAEKAGILRTGLSHPWNAQTAHPLFSNLGDVLQYINSHFSS